MCAAVLAAVALPLLVAACATSWLGGMPAGVLLPCIPQQGLHAPVCICLSEASAAGELCTPCHRAVCA
jgi:hypothetical protein